MSNVRGRIAVDVQFVDSTTSSDEKSLKTITLQDATEYTTGKVAIVTGTCGTEATTVASIGSFLPYRNASGAQVAFSSFDRIAVSSPERVILSGVGNYGSIGMESAAGRVSVCDTQPMPGIAPASNSLNVRATAGTASYTLVLYGT